MMQLQIWLVLRKELSGILKKNMLFVSEKQGVSVCILGSRVQGDADSSWLVQKWEGAGNCVKSRLWKELSYSSVLLKLWK